MNQPPAFRVYVSDEEGKIDFKDEAFALWQNQTRDGSKTYFAGKLKDGRRVQMWPVTPREPQEEVADAPF
jgi:hypothetical protein